MKNPPSERNRAIAARRAGGARFTDIAAEFGLSARRVKSIADAVALRDRGRAYLQADPWSLEGLELVGEISKLERTALEAHGIRRLSQIDGMSFVDLLRLPNISRRSATALIDLYAELKRTSRARR